jgi:hypothetical protein
VKQSIIGLVGIAMTMTPLLSATAMSAYPERPAAAASSVLTLVGMSCPVGTHWENAGYVRGGKWRAEHCASDNAFND